MAMALALYLVSKFQINSAVICDGGMLAYISSSTLSIILRLATRYHGRGIALYHCEYVKLI